MFLSIIDILLGILWLQCCIHCTVGRFAGIALQGYLGINKLGSH